MLLLSPYVSPIAAMCILMEQFYQLAFRLGEAIDGIDRLVYLLVKQFSFVFRGRQPPGNKLLQPCLRLIYEREMA